MNKLVMIFSGSDMGREYELIETAADDSEILHFMLAVQMEIYGGGTAVELYNDFQKKYGYKVVLDSGETAGRDQFNRLLKRNDILFLDTDLFYNLVGNVLN